jgi:hypothetical protein
MNHVTLKYVIPAELQEKVCSLSCEAMSTVNSRRAGRLKRETAGLVKCKIEPVGDSVSVELTLAPRSKYAKFLDPITGRICKFVTRGSMDHSKLYKLLAPYKATTHAPD